MKAKHYKKIRKWHRKAESFHEANIHRFWTNAPVRRASVHARNFHHDRAHKNYLKWYAAFTEGWKFGADANQIRKDHDYPEFNPKTAGYDEDWNTTVRVEKLNFGERFIIASPSIDDGI